MKTTLISAAVTAALTAPLATPVTADDSVTIYSSLRPGAVPPELYRPVAGRQAYGQVPGYGVVRHDRRYDIERGVSTLRVTDVAALIDPTTVTFTSLDVPATRVLEQNFQFDLVSQQRLLQRFIGERIVVEQFRGEQIDEIEGRLLGIADGLTLEMDDGSIRAVRSYGNLRFPELPGGLNTKPTLEWMLSSPRGGEQDMRLSYETQGMTWWADYNLVLDETDGCSIDLTSWVSIINQSGASYENARLKLIAGDVHRAEPAAPNRQVVARMAMAESMDAAAGFEEKAFFEYHLYTLGRPADLPDRSTKQLELIPATDGIACQKELVYYPTKQLGWWGYQQLDQGYGVTGPGDVDVYLRFENSEDNGLGVPLPAGRIRVNQLDPADDSLEFIGEDTLDHTPRNEDVLIEMGEAFDIVGERKVTNYRIDTSRKQLWETVEIKLRNHKDDDAEVIVLENLYRALNWELVNVSHDWDKENAHQARWALEVPADGETVLTYTAHYSW